MVRSLRAYNVTTPLSLFFLDRDGGMYEVRSYIIYSVLVTLEMQDLEHIDSYPLSANCPIDPLNHQFCRVQLIHCPRCHIDSSCRFEEPWHAL
jgi:hypothetical protein